VNAQQAMDRYDPLHAPPPDAWLAADEDERIERVAEYHRRARVKLPKRRLHACFHVIVENQVAMGDQLPARRVLERLQAEGLDRHDAIHAIGSVVADYLHDLLRRGAPSDVHEPYWAALKTLTAEEWRRRR
jgi:hypothetical protein